jgi:NADH:ubiquinone oxidoreductase subunit C
MPLKKNVELVFFEKSFSCYSLLPTIVFHSFKSEENSIILMFNEVFFSLKVLKEHINFYYNMLSCISGVDLAKKNFRFMLAYELLSLSYNARIRLKTFISDYVHVYSITSIFVNAGWWEREIWDFYGLYFENHLDLRRILTDYGFEGYPLRKDFPLSGFRELRYDNNQKAILSETIFFSQEFRAFTNEVVW